MADARRTVLLTGFAPFAGEALNPSWEAARGLAGQVIRGHRVVTALLPVEFAAVLPALGRALRAARPRVAIAVGLAGGRTGISLERVAINIVDARIPDNAGKQPIDVSVVRGGPAAYFSTLPIKNTLAELERAQLPAHISETAGTYVCNQVFYALLHATRRRRGLRAGFMHVPWLPEQAARHQSPGMKLEDMQRALEIALRTALTRARPTRIRGGAES